MNQWSMKETHIVTGYYIDRSDLAHTALCIKLCELMLGQVVEGVLFGCIDHKVSVSGDTTAG